jgi:hypothetical protein
VVLFRERNRFDIVIVPVICSLSNFGQAIVKSYLPQVFSVPPGEYDKLFKTGQGCSSFSFSNSVLQSTSYKTLPIIFFR